MQESKRKKTLEMTRLKLRFTGSLISQDLHDHFFFLTDFKDLTCQKFLVPAGYVEMGKKMLESHKMLRSTINIETKTKSLHV